MTKAVLDERMFKEGEYIRKGERLLRVEQVRVIGQFPTRRRLVRAEDSVTGLVEALTEAQMEKFTWVDRSLCPLEVPA